ncbi:MAG: HD-GYP domain-containing protein [Oscillospiraceae bacterium]|nr:HD-GYP domain-containing protein [Oscillospiraceae bacterium]
MSEGSGNLIPVSIRLLYDGMTVQDNVYDADGDRLLITAGNTLNADQIERIHRINSGRDTIFVTGRTHKTMVSKRPNIDIDSRAEVEENTGYTEFKDSTSDMLGEIAGKKKVSQESLNEVADALSDRIISTPPDVVMSLINSMAPVDEYLQRHSVNVGMLSGLIGQWFSLGKEHIDKLALIGLLHDCGNTFMPPHVLTAERKLTVVEYEVIKTHPVHTHELLAEFPEDVRLAASSHHERLDGSGYPKGLKGDAIPLEARIAAVADIYDAMTSKRPYRAPNSPFKVLAQLESLCSDKLDSNVVGVFKQNMPKELIDKPVTMSDGTIGIVREIDPDDIEFPKVEISKRVVKTSTALHCVSMFSDD